MVFLKYDMNDIDVNPAKQYNKLRGYGVKKCRPMILKEKDERYETE